MLLSPETLKQIKQIQIKAGYLTTDAMVGEYSSAFKGVGQEFDKVREYDFSDDVRSIDWNVTARMNEPYVKVYREEREMTLMLMVDVSPSQRFGSSARFKQELAAELAAMLAFLAIKNSDKVGLIVFSDHVEQFIPPKKGRSHVWNIIRTVISHKSQGKKTDLGLALSYLSQVWKKRSTCFLISDFEAKDYEKNIRIARKRHDLNCVVMKDLREENLPDCGIIGLRDLETGESFTLNTSNKKTRDAFRAQAIEKTEHLESLFRKNKIDHFVVDTRSAVVKALVGYFKKRERRSGFA